MTTETMSPQQIWQDAMLDIRNKVEFLHANKGITEDSRDSIVYIIDNYLRSHR